MIWRRNGQLKGPSFVETDGTLSALYRMTEKRPGMPELPEGGVAEEELPRMTLIDHLEELRKRIIRSLIVVFVG